MTKESLVARKEELQAALEQAKAQAVALQGALAENAYWLSKVDDNLDAGAPASEKE